MNNLRSKLKNKTVIDAFGLYFGRILNLSIGLVSTIIYGIVFSKKDIALISLFEMILMLFVSFGFTWSTLAITRFGKEEIKRNGSLNHTSSLRLGIITPLLVVSLFTLIYFRDYLRLYIGSKDLTIITYLMMNLILLLIHNHIIAILITVEKHFHNVLFYIGQSIGKICILGIFYFNMLNHFNAELYLKLNIFLSLLLLLIRCLFLEYRYFFPFIIGKKEEYLKQLKYVLPQIYGFGGLYIINWVDVYFIRKYWNFDDLGAYQFMYTIFLKLSSFAIILNTIFFPKIMEWKINNDNNLKKYLEKAPIILLLTTITCFSIFLIIYKPVFAVFFQDKYHGAYSAFNILILSLPFFFGSYLYVPVLNSYDRVQYIQFVNIFSASVNIIIDYLLIKKIGLVGAAIGTFVAYISKYLLLSLAVGSMFNIRYRLVHAICLLISVCVFVYILRISNIF